MGSLSIQKGKRAERQVAGLLNEIVGRVCLVLGVDLVKLQRNLKQTQQGGFDLDGLDWIAIEIKHHNVVALNSWWDQCLRQAGTTREPVLIWKKTGGKWNVRMWGRLEIAPGRRLRVPVDISWESFAPWFEKRCQLELEKSIESSLGVEPGLFPTSL